MNAIWRNFILSAICLGLSGRAGWAQVINFDVPGGAGAANYSGQGAYADPGHNYWNPVVGGGTTGPNDFLSDGTTPSPITLTSELGGTYGTQGTQGSPAALQQPYQYNSAALQTDKLNHVPSGTYDLYLYGINNTGTRGTTFTVSTSLAAPISQSTFNTPTSLYNFIRDADYVVFSNIVVGADGTITFTWVGNPEVTVTGNNEGDFNALQLVFVSTNTVVANPDIPDFGPHVLRFNPSMSRAAIQNVLSGVFADQQNSEFGTSRYALLFEPGRYTNLDVNLGYYTQVLGLGQTPDDVVITGNVHSEGALPNHSALINFWRACENLAVQPTNSNDTMTWAVSQGTSLRRMHIVGNLNLANTNNGAYSSGGFLADSRVDGTVDSLSQQQWLSRNDIWRNWTGKNWNMVFVGVSNPPSGTWPSDPYTVITNTPLICEAPYLYVDAATNLFVRVPDLETNRLGTSWGNGLSRGESVPIGRFYLAQPEADNAGSINAALNLGMDLILTPGIYHLTNSIQVTQPDTIILGLGFPTLIPTNRNPAMVISDVNGVKVSGIIFDAGTTQSPSLLQVGTTTNSADHSADPICLYDICCRVGGEFVGMTSNCVTINANDVIGDNLWLWRADHGAGVGWTQNVSAHGLVVNGNNVTIYGLFVEHHQQYQTLWNGNGGRVYFYQSELPYDPPAQVVWSEAPGVDGYASYKVADNVTRHEAYGLGVYAVFINSVNISCFNAMETPTNSQQVNLHHMMDVYIAGNTAGGGTSEITHIVNGTGNTVAWPVTTAYADYLWQVPQFSVSAGLDATGTNIAITFPTESWHSYQLQFKNTMPQIGWSDLNSPSTGNDALETVIEPISTSNQYYRIQAR